MTVYLPIDGSQQGLLPASQSAGPVDPNEISSVTVRLRSRGDPKTLISKAYELARQPLAQRQYLTHQDLADRSCVDSGSRLMEPRGHFARSDSRLQSRRRKRSKGRRPSQTRPSTLWPSLITLQPSYPPLILATLSNVTVRKRASGRRSGSSSWLRDAYPFTTTAGVRNVTILLLTLLRVLPGRR
jgi:hypothetical protein